MSDWQPIETVPSEVRVLLWRKDTQSLDIGILNRHPGFEPCFFSETNKNDHPREFTHWMLPDPPANAGEQTSGGKP